MHTILLADDEKEILDIISVYLEKDGYKFLLCHDGKEAWDAINQNTIDLAVIDIMMPKINGYELLKRIREKYNIPVIILSAKSLDSDKILGLGLGADDYMIKPFNPLELIARIEAQLRRHYTLSQGTGKSNQLMVGPLTLDVDQCLLIRGDEPIQLTSSEYRLLYTFMDNPGRVFTKRQLFETLRGDEYYETDENTIMVHISNLRNKIERDPKTPVYIKTIRGLGYKIEKNIPTT